MPGYPTLTRGTAPRPTPDWSHAAAVDAATGCNQHTGELLRATRDGDDLGVLRAWWAREFARYCLRQHLEDARRARFARTVSWIAGEVEA